MAGGSPDRGVPLADPEARLGIAGPFGDPEDLLGGGFHFVGPEESPIACSFDDSSCGERNERLMPSTSVGSKALNIIDIKSGLWNTDAIEEGKGLPGLTSSRLSSGSDMTSSYHERSKKTGCVGRTELLSGARAQFSLR